MRDKDAVGLRERGFVGLTAMLPLLLTLQAWAADKAITNDDVLALTRTGLSNPAIISTIRQSRSRFDLSPTAIVNLKQAGVSNAVIEAMLATGWAERHKPSTTEQGVRAGETSPVGIFPSAYGYYVAAGAHLTRLEPVPVITTLGIQPLGPGSGQSGWAADGLNEEPAVTVGSGVSPTVIVYQQDIDVSSLQIAGLEFTASMQAYQFNGLKTRREFFESIYRVAPEQEIVINLWRPRPPVQVSVEPVDARPGMFRISPEAPLEPGPYAVWLGKALHRTGTIFATDGARKESAFSFRVQSANP